MAQLSDDCFAFGGPMMSIDEAVGIITARVTPVQEIEIVSLIDADGRVLARDIAAPLPLPPFTNSAVDGYAVRSSDLPQGQEHGQEHGQKHGQQSRKEEQSKEAQGKDKRGNEQAFPIAGRAQAGGAVQAAQAGHAVRIFTGAPMPQGTDTVFMQEDVRIDESGRVILPPGLEAGANVRPAGEDVALGHVALRAGELLQPQHIALAAAFGLTELPVMRRIRVAVFSTGDELASPGTSRAAAQLFDSNRFMLTAMLRRLGAAVSDLGILRDERAPLARALSDAASAHDLLLTTGGVSTGEEDHVKAGVESVGSLVLWRMAIKPGRPVAMGIISGTPFVGLPGNPVASFVTFVHVVRPTVLALSGAAQRRLVPVPVRAAFSYKKKAGRREYVRVILRNGADGALEAVKFPREGAGLLSSLVDTDGLVELGENVTKVEPGMRVGFLGYENLI